MESLPEVPHQRRLDGAEDQRHGQTMYRPRGPSHNGYGPGPRLNHGTSSFHGLVDSFERIICSDEFYSFLVIVVVPIFILVFAYDARRAVPLLEREKLALHTFEMM